MDIGADMAKSDERQRIDGFVNDSRKGGATDEQIYEKLISSKQLPNLKGFIGDAKKGGATDIEIAAHLGLNLSKPKNPKDLGTQPTIKLQAEKPSLLADIGSGMDKMYSGVAQGAEYAADGIRGGLNKLLGTNLETDRYEKYTQHKADERKAYNEARKQSGKGINVGEFIGETVAYGPLAMLGRGYGAAKVLSKPGAKITLQNSAIGAAMGGTQFAENADKRLSNMTSGAIGGAVGGVAAKKVGDGVTKVVNAKQGRLKTKAQEVDDLAKEFNVSTTVGDLGRNPLVQKTEVAMESIPVIGTSKFRQTQHNQAKNAATKMVDSLKGKLDSVDYKSLDKIQKAASNGDKNALRIMNIVNEAGEDSNKILKAAAEIKNWRGQRLVSQVYDRVQKIAGDSAVAPNKTVQAIDDILAKDSKVTPNTELQSELLGIRKNLTDLNIKKDFKEMRAVQSRLGELVDKWGRQGESTSAFTKIRTAIDNDIIDFAQNSGNPHLFGELKRANSLYREIQAGKDKAFAKAISSNEPDQIFNQFIRAGKGDKAANFYKNLDPKGQAALRYQMAQNAFDKATNENTGSFSPAKFALEFEKLGAPYQHIFNGVDKAQMDGFVKLMRHIERAGQYAENPPTGNRVIPALLGGATVLEPTAMGVTGVSTSVLKFLFTSEAGKRILLAAKDLPPNSPKLANLLKQLQKLAVTSGAVSATE